MSTIPLIMWAYTYVQPRKKKKHVGILARHAPVGACLEIIYSWRDIGLFRGGFGVAGPPAAVDRAPPARYARLLETASCRLVIGQRGQKRRTAAALLHYGEPCICSTVMWYRLQRQRAARDLPGVGYDVEGMYSSFPFWFLETAIVVAPVNCGNNKCVSFAYELDEPQRG